MRIRTSELTGHTLDRAVGKALGWITYPSDSIEHGQWYHTNPSIAPHGFEHNRIHISNFNPSTDWAHGGPIIERERISIYVNDNTLYGVQVGGWLSGSENLGYCESGPTPLIAGLRCYVALKMGEVIDMPDEVLKYYSI
jgi:hypothetical protein